MVLHAEIQALQQRFGLSYKNAAHWLYMAELERIKKAKSASKSFLAIRERLDHIVMEEIIPLIDSIDKGEWDERLFKDGLWQYEGEDGKQM